MNLEILFSFCLACVALAISPGPDNIFVLMQSITNGKRYGLATVAGLMTGCLVHTTLLALGVSIFIRDHPLVYTVIKTSGAFYLLFLAYKVYRGSTEISIQNNQKPAKSLVKMYMQGVVMNVLNPKVAIFFLALFPGFLFSTTLNITSQFYILGGLFILCSAIVFSCIALLSGFITKWVHEFRNLGLVLKWLQILIFISIAIYFLIG